MRTLIASPCYLDGLDGFGSDRLERNLKYVKWYSSLKEQGHLNFDKIILYDNASSIDNVQKLIDNTNPNYLNIVCYKNHLARTSNLGYEYCWRFLKSMPDMIKLYQPDKILFIDSDLYILNKELCNFINKKNDGWYSFFCRKHMCPEAAFHVLNKGSFDLFLRYVENCDNDIGKMMENVLPFTEVVTKYVGDRYPEYGDIPQMPFMDYYAQATTKMNFTFNPISPR